MNAKKFREYCEREKISPLEVSKLLRVSLHTVYAWRSGTEKRSNIPAPMIELLKMKVRGLQNNDNNRSGK